jgi:hypothetical protein
MVCPDCGFAVTGSDESCPRCRARIKTWSLTAHAAPEPIRPIDDPAFDDSADPPRLRIRPLHGILFFLLVGVPSMLSLVWLFLHNSG